VLFNQATACTDTSEVIIAGTTDHTCGAISTVPLNYGKDVNATTDQFLYRQCLAGPTCTACKYNHTICVFLKCDSEYIYDNSTAELCIASDYSNLPLGYGMNPATKTAGQVNRLALCNAALNCRACPADINSCTECDGAGGYWLGPHPTDSSKKACFLSTGIPDGYGPPVTYTGDRNKVELVACNTTLHCKTCSTKHVILLVISNTICLLLHLR
jgi:hypothetical protein